jgi:inorganic pyrophosphatase
MITMSLWHRIDRGKKTPEEFFAIIEIQEKSKIKYEVNKKNGLLELDRFLFSAFTYPANYGFIPQTYCDDEDPLDVLVFCQEPILPLTLVKVRPIGVFKMLDQGTKDDKILAVVLKDPYYESILSLEDLSKAKRLEIEHFFSEYKSLEKKKVQTQGFGDKEEALTIIKNAIDYYDREKEHLQKK